MQGPVGRGRLTVPQSILYQQQQRYISITNYLGCNESTLLFKPIEEIGIDVVSTLLFFVDVYEFHARMVKWQDILVAVFWQINWVTRQKGKQISLASA